MEGFSGNELGVAATYLGVINAVAFGSFAWDKHCARQGSWRVPERRLLWLAVIGGTFGAFAGQQILRHKTHKQPFRSRLSIVAGLQTIVLAGLLLLRLQPSPL